MKKFYSFAAMSLLAAAGLVVHGAAETGSIAAPEVVSAPMQQESQSGEAVIKALRKAYETGRYESMLAGLNVEYQKAAKEGQLEARAVPLMNEREEAFSSRWEALSQQLIEERNLDLKGVGKDSSDLILKQRISSVTNKLTPQQKEALSYISSLRAKDLKQAANEEEKSLIEIDLATEFKIAHLESQSAQLSAKKRMEDQIVLQMDMLKQMQRAAKSFQDEGIKKKVNMAASASDVWQARYWDMNQLKTMAKKPSNEAEKKLSCVLSSHKTKESDLYRAELSALQKEKNPLEPTNSAAN